jgi:tellurite resistance protein TehA-like permease
MMESVAAPRIVDIDLPPDVFAVVMATGIIAVSAADHRYSRIAAILGWAASATFAVLTLGLGARILARFRRVAAQARDPDVALRMFTFVAAAAVLGVHWRNHPAAVWLFGALALLGTGVLAPLAVTDLRSRSGTDLRDHAHGAWLLPSVAASGLATTAADIAMMDHETTPVIVGMAFWAGAILVYLGVAWLLTWRGLSKPFGPESVTPDSWILMGALAIATLAGDHLLAAARAVPAMAPAAGPIHDATLVGWIVASLWIPPLIYAELWRVDQRAGSLHFEGVWWSAVFPLGMYSAASAATATQGGLPELSTISLVFFWVAATVWLTVAVGLTHFALVHRAASR